jgi:aspartyl-tRNA(Asn)/glutamyl-tRNA(Gln) amidotransferase subunit C
VPRADDDATRARISREEAEHVAALARLALDDDELERITQELAGILEHFTEIAALDLDDVPPTSHPLPLVNVTRPDAVAPTLSRDEVLAAAPDTEDGRFRVPRILEAE